MIILLVSVQKKVKDVAEFKELVKSETPKILQQQQSQLQLQSQQEQRQQQQYQQPQTSIISTSNIITLLNKSNTDLWISKTDDPDIYNIYDNHNILTSNKLGIAFIASLQDSIKMRNVFKDKSTTITIKFRCNYNEKFKKYQPIEQVI